MTLNQWAGALGVSKEKVLECFEYLKKEGIGNFSDLICPENERIKVTSRRMVRDDRLSKIRAKCGRLGMKSRYGLLQQTNNKILTNQQQNTEEEIEEEIEEESLKEKGGMGEKEKAFEIFWSTCPSRNGKKLYRQEALNKFCQLSIDEIPLCLDAVRNYANSSLVKQGIGIKDPHRFLWNGREKSWFWKEWVEPEKINKKPIGSDDYDKPY